MKKPIQKELTEKQMAVAKYFVGNWKKNGFWPTMKEAAADFSVQVGAIQTVFRALEKKEILHRVPFKQRAIKLGTYYRGTDS